MKTMYINHTKHEGETLEEMSKIYCEKRDNSGQGASKFTPVVIRENGVPIAHISYNVG